MKFETFYLAEDCWSDCKTRMEECDNNDQGAMVYFENLKEIIFFLEEIKAYAVQMNWLTGDEISEDAPGWVSLMINLNSPPIKPNNDILAFIKQRIK